VVLPLSVHMENHVCLSHGVQVICAVWQAVTRIMAGVADLVHRIRDGEAQVGNSVAGRLRGRVMLYVVCTIHKETRSACFLVWPQNQCRQFLLVWPQNRWHWVFRFGPQNRHLRFGDLYLKIITIVSWFEPQNQVSYGLSVAS
jgi:hypothetical protein